MENVGDKVGACVGNDVVGEVEGFDVVGLRVGRFVGAPVSC